MFVVVALMEAEPAHIAALRGALIVHARYSLMEEAGCQHFDVCEDPTDLACFLLYEIYEDEEAFEAHRETPHFKQFNDTTSAWIASKKVLTYGLISDHGLA